MKGTAGIGVGGGGQRGSRYRCVCGGGGARGAAGIGVCVWGGC